MNDFFLAYIKLGGGTFFFLFLFPILIFSIYTILKVFFFKKKGERLICLFPVIQLFSVLLVFSFVYAISLFILTKLNTQTPHSKIIWASDICAMWDEKIFRVNLPFWMQDKNNSFKCIFDFFSSTLIHSYSLLIPIFGLTLLLSIVKKFSLFIRFIFSFTVVVWISFPIWYLIPAYTPANVYVNDFLSHTPSLSIQKSLDNYQPNNELVLFIEKIKNTYRNKTANVSTFPSMHIAWSIIILYFSFKIWKPLLVIIAPYTFLNIVSTVFTLQHYGVDTFSGIAVAIVAIYLSSLIKYSDSGKEITYLIRSDLLNTWKFYQENARLVVKLFKNRGKI